MAIDKVEKNKIFLSIYLPGIFILLLWVIQLYQFFLGNLSSFGLLPRKTSGLIGILTAPLIHADFTHIISNSIPLYICLALLIYSYRSLAYKTFFIIYLGSGILVWIFARQNIHIGASGLVYGLFGFLFLSGLIRRNINLLAITLLVTFLYGSIVWGIMPMDLKVSWESHLFGLLMGFFCALIFRNQGPPPPIDPFEDEEDDDDNLLPPNNPEEPRVIYMYRENDPNIN
jgi:membrane associated rhomboid family serine protease